MAVPAVQYATLLACLAVVAKASTDSTCDCTSETDISADDKCDHTGDGDLVGFGVRLGVYLQGFAILVDNVTILVKKLKGKDSQRKKLPNPGPKDGSQNEENADDGDRMDAIQTVLFTVTALLIAMNLRVAHNTLSDFVFIVAGLVVTVQLINILALLPDILKLVDNSLGTYAILSAVNSYQAGMQLWFWAVGYKPMQQKSCGPTYFWLLTRFDAYGPFRIVMIACCSTMLGLQLLLLPLAVMVRKAGGTKSIFEPSTLGLSLITFAYVFVFSVLVAATEMTIKANAITGIRDTFSTGQMLALLMGVMTSLWSLVDFAVVLGMPADNPLSSFRMHSSRWGRGKSFRAAETVQAAAHVDIDLTDGQGERAKEAAPKAPSGGGVRRGSGHESAGSGGTREGGGGSSGDSAPQGASQRPPRVSQHSDEAASRV